MHCGSMVAFNERLRISLDVIEDIRNNIDQGSPFRSCSAKVLSESSKPRPIPYATAAMLTFRRGVMNLQEVLFGDCLQPFVGNLVHHHENDEGRKKRVAGSRGP